tara:strand:+ start:7415 stop:7657 length:243 start_codon:yes stop_codon:yes gene_type:complete
MSDEQTGLTGDALVSMLRPTDEWMPPALPPHVAQLQRIAANEIERLTAAIAKHRDAFGLAGLEADHELWATISERKEKSN